MNRTLLFLVPLIFVASTQAQDSSFKLPEVPIPANNPQTAQKVHLGKQLFFDPRLSITGTVSCASCHNPLLGGTDGRATSVGVRGQRGGRNAPSVYFAAYLSKQFWDGREDTLEAQALGPLTNPIEMGMKSHEQVIAVLKKIPGYAESFQRAFPKDDNPITKENLAKAIAAFERELTPKNSKFDQYLEGHDDALNESAKRGFEKFKSIGCASCHSGPAFAGNRKAGPGRLISRQFPQNQNTEKAKAFIEEYDLVADKGIEGQGEWRVAPLRNIALTAPYFHNGKVTDLKEAIRIMASLQLFNDNLKEEDVEDIYQFLLSLTGETPKVGLSLADIPRTPGSIVIPEPDAPPPAPEEEEE